jgi:hypothetical protein
MLRLYSRLALAGNFLCIVGGADSIKFIQHEILFLIRLRYYSQMMQLFPHPKLQTGLEHILPTIPAVQLSCWSCSEGLSFFENVINDPGLNVLAGTCPAEAIQTE